MSTEPSIEIKILGSEIKLTGKPSQLHDINKLIEPIVQQIDKNIINLNKEEKALLRQIEQEARDGNKHKLPKDFERGSDEHETYRSLRRRHLIRPVLSGKWEAGKEVEITDFGRAVLDIKRDEIWPEENTKSSATAQQVVGPERGKRVS
jgi:hypothetical protein